MMMVLLRSGGLQCGVVNFDAKRRRNSTDLSDTFHGHIGGMDVFARALLIADDLIQKSPLEKMRAERYATFDRSEEHTSELQSRGHLVCRLLLEKKNWLPY